MTVDLDKLRVADDWAMEAKDSLELAIADSTSAMKQADALTSIAESLFALYHLERAKLGVVSEPVE